MATISTNNQPTPIQIQYETLIAIANLCKDLYNEVVQDAQNNPDTENAKHAEWVIKGIEYVFDNIAGNIQDIAEREGLELPMVRDDVAEQNQDVSNVQPDVEQ